jgi:hypothetical protein
LAPGLSRVKVVKVRTLPHSPLLWVLVLSACGGQGSHFAATDDAPERSLPTLAEAPTEVAEGAPPTSAEGELDGFVSVTARSSFAQGLGSLHYVVSDGAGDVVTTGYNEVSGVGDADRRLLVKLAPGAGYRLALTSTTAGKRPITCTASLGPFAVEPEAAASYQVFVWQCDDAPKTAVDECYWLVDWTGATRTSAGVGELIGLSASAHDAQGNPARFTWSAPGASSGEFSDERARETTFRCRTRAAQVPLKVSMSDGVCSREITQIVACR